MLILLSTRSLRALTGGMVGWLLCARTARVVRSLLTKRDEATLTLRALLCFSLALGKIEVIMFLQLEMCILSLQRLFSWRRCNIPHFRRFVNTISKQNLIFE